MKVSCLDCILCVLHHFSVCDAYVLMCLRICVISKPAAVFTNQGKLDPYIEFDPAPLTPAGRSPVPAAPQQSSQLEQELIEVKGQLRSAEEQNGELAEQLKITSASVEQYRTVVLTLEDSLKKEKEVRLFFFLTLYLFTEIHYKQHNSSLPT